MYKAIFIMGVSGCGKSTIAKMISKKTGIPFIDGDDFHPQSNIDKMKNGTPLTDNDREGWLKSINNEVISALKVSSIIIACSALKNKYRETLSKGIKPDSIWVYLKGDYELIRERMKEREGHFMPAGLLQSQFETLEPPIDAHEIPIILSKETITNEIIYKLDLKVLD